MPFSIFAEDGDGLWGVGGEGLDFGFFKVRAWTHGGLPLMDMIGYERGDLQTGGCEYTGTAFLGQSTCTNHRNRGRTSADRSTKATLMLTVPRSLIKSSTKDLT